jgi:peptide-methionine (S)-S-oxide reductase
MSKWPARIVSLMMLLTGIAAVAAGKGPFPGPLVDAARTTAPGQESAVFAGGCFWGVQAVFQHVKGVLSATSGYSGGEAKTAEYETVSSGRTGHAESVKVVFDPSQVTYGELLRVFFSVAHDPTELNRQGPDEGTQYRSVIFYTGDQQKKIADAYIAQLDGAGIFRHKIVTEVAPLKAFYAAEAYHQNYAANHPTNMYIVVNDAPKVGNLRKQFPELYSEK